MIEKWNDVTLAILSALPEEQAGIAALLQSPTTTDRASRRYTRGLLHGVPVVLALSGIGKVAAASTTTTLIERFGATRIVFTGVAGGVGESVQVGDVVVGQQYAQHDMDASPILPRYQLPGYGRALLDGDAALSQALAQSVAHCLASGDAAIWTAELGLAAPRLHQGLIASGDRFVCSAAEVAALRSGMQAAGMDPLAVEMEGAAVAQVCADHGLPFAAMRSISDRADDNAHVDFPLFVQRIARNYACAVIPHLCEML